MLPRILLGAVAGLVSSLLIGPVLTLIIAGSVLFGFGLTSAVLQ